jgi:RimJ/RimL family protein N-acetyltransferase
MGAAAVGNAAGSIVVPDLVSRRCELRPVQLSDIELIAGWETGGENLVRWRLHGSTPSPDGVRSEIWNGVLAQFVVVSRRSGSPAGLVSLYNPSFVHGHAYVGALQSPDFGRSALTLEGLMLLVDHAFRCWTFRKLYAEVLSFNLAQFASGIGRVFTVEGTKREHFFYDGAYWDEHLLALTRGTWEGDGLTRLRAVLGMASARQGIVRAA